MCLFLNMLMFFLERLLKNKNSGKPLQKRKVDVVN